MIKVHQFSRCWNVPNPSPFCMKLETYLKMAEISHEIITDNAPQKAPKKKMPFIDDEGKRIADSRLIINYLKAKYGDNIDNDLSTEQEAMSMAVTAMCDEHLYWGIIYSRWFDDSGWMILEPAFFGHIKQPMRLFLVTIIKRNMRNQLYQHGMGRHAREEIYSLCCEDVVALAHLLADKDFLFGEKPHIIDATIHAYLANILYTPFNNPMKATAQEFPQLDAYCQRMNKLYYPNNKTKDK